MRNNLHTCPPPNMRPKPHRRQVTAAKGAGVFSRVIQLLSSRGWAALSSCSWVSCWLSPTHPVHGWPPLGALSKLEGMESTPGKKKQLSSAISHFMQGSWDSRTRSAHGAPREKRVLGWELKGSSAGGHGVQKKISHKAAWGDRVWMLHEMVGGVHDLPGSSVPRPWPSASQERGNVLWVSAKSDVAGLRTVCTAYRLPCRAESNECSFQHTKQHRALQREKLTPSSIAP